MKHGAEIHHGQALALYSCGTSSACMSEDMRTSRMWCMWLHQDWQLQSASSKCSHFEIASLSFVQRSRALSTASPLR